MAARVSQLVVVSLMITWTLIWVPEIGEFEPMKLLALQLSPLWQGYDSPYELIESPMGSLPLIIALGALVTEGFAGSKNLWLRTLAPIGTALSSILALTMLLRIFDKNTISEIATSSIILTIITGFAVVATFQSIKARNAETSSTTQNTPNVLRLELAVFAWSFVGPIAIGRSLFGRDMSFAANKLSEDPSGYIYLFNVATIWLFFTGLAAILIPWSILTAIIKNGSERFKAIMVLALAAGPGLFVLGPTASSVATSSLSMLAKFSHTNYHAELFLSAHSLEGFKQDSL
ncbi:hypothetical protein [Kocuria rosea]|uniref:hypothetical protein n=1 Tax=Kocuria rosea TaxID=1275 RepID=UPI0025B7A52D|nr:hypothetical protein [Kocuria rosea]WJZ68348.1 hypothetical protein QR564_18015 [Kocuria rosea]